MEDAYFQNYVVIQYIHILPSKDELEVCCYNTLFAKTRFEMCVVAVAYIYKSRFFHQHHQHDKHDKMVRRCQIDDTKRIISPQDSNCSCVDVSNGQRRHTNARRT